MITTVPPPTLAPQDDDPVRAALTSAIVRQDLIAQAVSRLNRWLADRPKMVRLQEAEVIVNETLKRAWERRATFDPARDVGGWLHGILSNVASEKCRELRKQPAQLPEKIESAAREVSYGQEPGDLTRLLNHLNATDRNLVTWAVIENLSHKEIGERLNIREDASRQRLRRLLNDMKHEFQALLREGDR